MENDGLVEDVIEEVLVPASEEKSFFHIFYTIFSTLEANGWYILFFGILLYYLYTKYKPQITRAQNARQSASAHVNEEDALDRIARIEAARNRQQAQMDAAAAKYKEEKRIKDEKAALAKAEEWERHKQGLGYHSKIKKETDDADPASLGLSKGVGGKPKLRGSDYNPLTGQSSSSNDSNVCYRPNRRDGGGSRGG